MELGEHAAAVQVLATTYHSTPPCLAQEGGYNPRPKKGKPISKAPLQRRIMATSGYHVVITGPDYVGCTTLLAGLRKVGYVTRQLAPKPAPEQRPHFQPDHF